MKKTIQTKSIYLVFYILSLIFLSPRPAEAVRKVEANPINVAYILAQETDSAGIDATCKYYGYELQTSNDGYTTYKHTNGSIIRYTFKDTSNEQPYPKVEVKSKVSSKEIDTILTDLGFQKEGSGYKRKVSQYARSIFSCKHNPQGFLILHQSRTYRH